MQQFVFSGVAYNVDELHHVLAFGMDIDGYHPETFRVPYHKRYFGMMSEPWGDIKPDVVLAYLRQYGGHAPYPDTEFGDHVRRTNAADLRYSIIVTCFNDANIGKDGQPLDFAQCIIVDGYHRLLQAHWRATNMFVRAEERQVDLSFVFIPPDLLPRV